ncbi:MAG TPA: mechanosensitive ion channel domain-containing protein [Xanthomonadales bacterium]|nr:mechanosensitive ion channel domain-containing protein [Xanthomonadales bacterium]
MDYVERIVEHGWGGFALVVAASLLAALVLHRFVLVALRRALPEASLPRLALERTRLGISLLLPLLALQLALAAAPLAPRVLELARHALLVAWLLLATYIVIRMTSAVGDAVLRRHAIDVADNLEARRIHTQTRVLARSVQILVGIVGFAVVLMTFPGVRQLGASLLASAGLAGIVVGFAARPVLENLIGGLQLALTQPIRIDDVVIVEGEYARVEEIGAAFVVLRTWDERRLVVPLTWFISHPFENWTYKGAALVGTVFWWVDFSVPGEAVRREAERFVAASPHWDRRSFSLQVTDANERGMQLRASVSAADSGALWNLRVALREHVLGWLAARMPEALPRLRAQLDDAAPGRAAAPRAARSG